MPATPSLTHPEAFPAEILASLEAGEYRSALQQLQQSAVEDWERLAMDLRIAAFEAQHWPEPETAWPGPFEDEFDQRSGLVEINASQLDANTLKAGLLGHGGVIVRGLLGEPEVSEIRGLIDRALDARHEYEVSQGQKSGAPWYERSPRANRGPVQFPKLGNGAPSRAGAIWAVDSPPVACRLIELYQRLGIPALMDGYFGEPAALSVRKWVLRCMEPSNGGQAGWHQDGKFMGDGIRTVNMWIALSDCGGDADAPGMEIVTGGERAIYETGTEGAPFDWTVGQGLVDKLAAGGAKVECPRFAPGDAVFFDHYNLHRTGFGTDHCSNRYAVESWFFAASRAPQKQVPVLL